MVFFLKNDEGVVSSIFYFRILILEGGGSSSSESMTIGFLFFFEEVAVIGSGWVNEKNSFYVFFNAGSGFNIYSRREDLSSEFLFSKGF